VRATSAALLTLSEARAIFYAAVTREVRDRLAADGERDMYLAMIDAHSDSFPRVSRGRAR
jgi:hypothetical protein